MVFFDLRVQDRKKAAKNVKWHYKTNITRFSLFLCLPAPSSEYKSDSVWFDRSRMCVRVYVQERHFALIDKWLYNFTYQRCCYSRCSCVYDATHTHAGLLNRSKQLLFIQMSGMRIYRRNKFGHC